MHESATAHYNIGICQYQSRTWAADADDLDGAIASWTTALKLAPDSADAHTNLASAYIMSKPPRADLALEHLRYVAH